MCSIEELEALVAGTLEADAAARVQTHVDGCASCREELQWLRAEAELMARRRDRHADVSPALWEGIEARLMRPPAPAASAVSAPTATPVRAARRWGLGARIAYGGLVTAAAAAVIVAIWPGQVHNVPGDLGRPAPVAAARKKLSADAALDQAEREYLSAAKVLEAEYQAERGRLPPSVAERYDRMLNKTRTQVADARVQAGNDVDGRMVVLDGYAEYLRSLQTIVSDIR
jgi:Putative zinc-finger